MNLLKAYWYSVYITFKEFFIKMTFVIMICLTAIYAVIIFHADEIKTGLAGQLKYLLFMGAGIYAILIICLIPSIFTPFIHIKSENKFLSDKNADSPDISRNELKEICLTREAVYNQDWFYCVSFMNVYIYNKSYIKKIVDIKDNQSRNSAIYKVKILAQDGHSYWLSFRWPEERNHFIRWYNS